MIHVHRTEDVQKAIDHGDTTPPMAPAKVIKGEWHPNEDGSGYWCRVDMKAERFRPPYGSGPAKSEVTRRVTTDLATGRVLEDTDTFAHTTRPCAPIAPMAGDDDKPQPG